MSLIEKKYTTTEREALAVIYACKKFQHYLLGYMIVFHTDHDSLKYLVNKPDLSCRIARWILLLQEFNYEVMVNLERLTRMPITFQDRGGPRRWKIYKQSFLWEYEITIRGKKALK